MDLVNSTILHVDNRYEVGLPWIDRDVNLPNNYSSALRRFYQLEKKFKGDSNFAVCYQKIIDEYTEKGFARKLKFSELKAPHPRSWYLPHHGVLNAQKPDKVQVVFDASARHVFVSLNSVLLKGPNLLVDLNIILTRFRQRAIPISADIAKMFLQVKVKPEDQPAFRFIWRPPGVDVAPHTYQMMVRFLLRLFVATFFVARLRTINICIPT